MDSQYGLETLALHGGQVPDRDTGSRAFPIYQTTSYVFENADQAAGRFALTAPGHIYTRLGSPTTEGVEKRLAAIHGGGAAVCAASGMAAIFNTVCAITSQGQNFVCSQYLYGGTYTLFGHTLRRFGIEARFVDTGDPAAVERAIDDRTRFVFSESVGNPKGNVDDFAALAEAAHRHAVPFILDNTFTPPPVFNPFAHGVDVAVYSLTKMIGGHGVSIGGATVEKGDFDWKTPGKFPEISEPDPSYHGMNFWDSFGDHDKAAVRGAALTTKIRAGVLRDAGGCPSPFNSWTFLLGLETLPLRAARHCANAREVARWLDANPLVDWVEYAGLPGHPDYGNARKYMPLGPGAVFCFGIRGGYEAGRAFIDSVRLLSHLANVLDAKSLVIHPASTTHQQLSDAEQAAAGVLPGMVRLSVGLEDVKDIIADIDQALRAAAGS